MAILKHIASKNADYGEAQRYLMFQYDKDTSKPALDENSELIPRKEYIMDSINCDPFTFDMECRELNALYHKNESYQQFCKAKNKGQFRKEHTTEIALYEAARKFLKGQSTDGRLPSMKLLKAEKDNLLRQKKETQKTYHYYRDYQKELTTVCSNVDMILGRPHNKQTEKEKNTDIS